MRGTALLTDLRDLTAEIDGPLWPPPYRTPVALYPDTDGQRGGGIDAVVLAWEPPLLSVVPATGLDDSAPAIGATLRVLFPGNAVGWGFDATVRKIERLPTYRWELELGVGPIPVERRVASRATTHDIVVIHASGLIFPALMLDASKTGARCTCSRGARIEVGQRVEVEPTRGDAFPTAGSRSGEIVWWRMSGRGIDFGVSYD